MADSEFRSSVSRGSPDWRHALALLLTLSGLGFLAYLAWEYRVEVVAWHAEADLRLTIASLVTLSISNVGVGMIFVSSIERRVTAETVDRRALFGTFLLSQLGKYIPGRVWGVVMQHAIAGRNLPLRTVVSANLEIAVLAAVVTAGAAMMFAAWSISGTWAALLVIVLVLATSLALLAFPLTNRLAQLLGFLFPSWRDNQQASEFNPKAPIAWLGIFGLLVFVLGFCAGWFGLVAASGGVVMQEALRLTAMLSLSYVAGLVSMLPAGIGAREATLVALGAWFEPELAKVASLAVVTRLAMLVVDLGTALLAGFVLLVSRRS